MLRNLSQYTAHLLLVTVWFHFSPLPCYGSQKKVLTTILPLYIFTGNILSGTDGVTVDLLMEGENANPHTFSMRLSDIKRLSSADVIIANGKAEEFLDLPALEEINPRAKIVLVHRHSIGVSSLPRVDLNNPHTWVSPKRAILECRAIGDVLKELIPEQSDLIESNLQRFTGRLKELSRELSSIIDRKGVLEVITFHDGLDIFAADYGISVLHHIEETHGVPPSPKKLAIIFESISNRGGKVVLVGESPVLDEVTVMISRKSKAPAVWFDPVITGEKSLVHYERTIRSNVTRLVSSLGR